MSNSNSTPPHRVPPYKRPIVIVSFLLLLAVVVVVTILIFKNFKPAPSTTDDPTTNPPVTSDPVDTPPSREPIDEPDTKPSPYEGEDPNLRNELTGHISYKNIDYGSNQLIASVSIDQYLVNGGECQLQLLDGDVVLANTTLAAQPDISTSVCGPFNVPIIGIPQGTYQIRILVTSDDRQGTIEDRIDI